MAYSLLLAGYIGCGNLGDDAIMMGLVHGLTNEFEITVLSGAPEETYRYYGFPAVPRRDMKLVAEAIEKCDALVFPGGSIFQDSTSMMSPSYYAKLVEMAKKAKKKVIMLGQGVGPLTTFLGKRAALGAFNAADAIAVRDPSSLTALRTLGVKTMIRVTADMAFLMPAPEASGGDDENFKVGNMRAIGVAPRALPKPLDAATLFGDFCRLLFQSGVMPVLIPMDKNEDAPLIQEISNRQGGRIPDLRKLATPGELLKRMDRMDGVVAVRLHAGILAASVGSPPLMIGYDPKVTAFAKMLELGPALALDGLTAQRMFDAFTAFQKERDRNVRLLVKKREEMIKLAMLNVELLRDTLAKP